MKLNLAQLANNLQVELKNMKFLAKKFFFRSYTRVLKGTILADHDEENDMYYELRTNFNSW